MKVCSWLRKICYREGNFFRCMCIRIQHREIQDIGNSQPIIFRNKSVNCILLSISVLCEFNYYDQTKNNLLLINILMHFRIQIFKAWTTLSITKLSHTSIYNLRKIATSCLKFCFTSFLSLAKLFQLDYLLVNMRIICQFHPPQR